MAVELDRLHHEIYSKYNVHLETASCFNKKISWLHILENIEFAQFLHGDELIFNSSLNDASEEERKNYIDQLLLSKSGGLIVSLQAEHPLSQSLIDYCNEKQFPVLTTDWETPFINITRIFSEILINNERTEMDLIAAFKNALNHPNDTNLYLPYFEAHHFSADSSYIVSVIGSSENYTVDNMKWIEKALQSSLTSCIVFEGQESIVVLTSGYEPEELLQILSSYTNRFSNLRIGIGSLECHLMDIHRSFKNAQHAYRLCGTVFTDNPLCYKDIGIYQILTDMKNPETICLPFVQNTLGKLIEHDKVHHTKYLSVLKNFFENDCSITQTANATFYHQNTLKYKVKNIKEILGYDIMTNENRVKIMLALYILDLNILLENV